MTAGIYPAFIVPSVQQAMGVSTNPDRGDVPASPAWLEADDTKTMAKTVDELLLAATPIISALTIAGYDLTAMAVAPTDATDHLYVDLTDRHFWIVQDALATGIGQPTPPTSSSGLAIALGVQPRRRYRPYGLQWDLGANLAMDLPSVLDTGDQGPALTDGIGHWMGSGGPADPLAILHDPRAISPSTDGWLVIGHDTSDATNEAKIGAAIGEATGSVAALVAADLVAAWNAQPTVLPGLLGLLDTRTWRFLDGPSPFASVLRAKGEQVQAWLGRSVGSQAAIQASPADITDFFNSETWQRTSSLKRWLESATGDKDARAAVMGIAIRASGLGGQEPSLLGATVERVTAMLELPWMEALMSLHELALLDVVGREDLATADHQWIPLDATGTYERRTTNLKLDQVTTPTALDHGHGTDTLQVKVVGNKLWGRWQEHPRFMGSIRPLDRWELDASTTNQAPSFVGTATTQGTQDQVTINVVSRLGRVMIDLVTPSETIHFMKTSRELFLEDDELQGQKLHPQFNLLEADQRSPLHSFELDELNTIAKALITDIDLCTDGVVSTTLSPAELEANFTEAIRPFFNAQTPTAGDHLVQARIVLRNALIDSRRRRGWYFPISRNEVVSHHRLLVELHQANATVMPTVAAFFELDATQRHFWYEWKIFSPPFLSISGQVVWGVSIHPLAKMTITKWRYQAGQDDHREWTSDYWAILGGTGLGATVELTTGLLGSGQSWWVAMDMLPSWFENARLFSGGAQAGLGGGSTYSKSFLTFIQPIPDSQGNQILWTNASGWSEALGIYGGSELVVGAGVLFPWSQGVPTLPPSIAATMAPVVIDAPINSDNNSGFFATDQYTRDAEIDEWLEEFCKANLDLLRDRNATLAIVGHADPRADDQYNLVLSRNRALAVYQRIIDLMGPHMAIRKERTFIGGRGEWESAGLTDPTQFSAQRRVDLHLDGRRIISVRAFQTGENPAE